MLIGSSYINILFGFIITQIANILFNNITGMLANTILLNLKNYLSKFNFLNKYLKIQKANVKLNANVDIINLTSGISSQYQIVSDYLIKHELASYLKFSDKIYEPLIGDLDIKINSIITINVSNIIISSKNIESQIIITSISDSQSVNKWLNKISKK